MKENEERRDVHAIITNRIIEQLEQGIVPWRKPWKEAGLPKNLITQKPYRGINVLLLASLGYDLNFFLTFKQVKSLGGSVRKGEKPCPVVFWKLEEKEEEGNPEKVKVFLLKYHNVFNIAQCVGIPEDKIPTLEFHQNDCIQVCEEIINSMPLKPRFRHDQQQAYYSPKYDYISIPAIDSFESSELYYGTLFHELIHSTGHQKRLNRKELMEMNPFGSKSYSIEELTAEIGSCFLNSYAGIENEDISNNVAYIGEWLKKLQNNKKFIFYASSHAQKATDFVLDIKREEQVTEPVHEEESVVNENMALYGLEHYLHIHEKDGQMKNPDLDKTESWEAFDEQFTSWDEILTHCSFFNETEKKLTLSKDTLDDPQNYSFYRPKQNVPYWVEKNVEVSV